MRPSCWGCCYKHVSDAAIADDEMNQGYPRFKMYVAGNLSHAASEIVEFYPELAQLLRAHRLRFCAEPFTHKVPYEGLAEFVDMCAECHSGNAGLPDIPAELLVEQMKAESTRGGANSHEGALLAK